MGPVLGRQGCVDGLLHRGSLGHGSFVPKLIYVGLSPPYRWPNLEACAFLSAH